MMAYEMEGRKIADDLKSQYGNLKEMMCLLKTFLQIACFLDFSALLL